MLYAKDASDKNLTIRHEWIADPPNVVPEAYFTNLKDHDIVESPFVAKFGMNFWGIAPAGHNLKNTGHHHLLIDSPLPIPIDSPIPFVDNKYVHFGKGQMEAILNLPAGEHTLRLLLADHEHKPFYVYSKELHIQVVKNGSLNSPSKLTKDPEVAILSPASNSEVYEYFRVLFHASNLNVASQQAKLENTGFFRLAVEHSKKSNTQYLDFSNGQTDAYLKLPKGKVKLQLLYVKNPNNAVHTVKSEWVAITVK